MGRRQSYEEFTRPSAEFLAHQEAKKRREAEEAKRQAEEKQRAAAEKAERARKAQEDAERRIADRIAAQILKGQR